MSNLPNVINVQRTMTYNVDLIRNACVEFDERTAGDVTDKEVIDWLHDWIEEDFSGGNGTEQWLTSDGDEIEL